MDSSNVMYVNNFQSIAKSFECASTLLLSLGLRVVDQPRTYAIVVILIATVVNLCSYQVFQSAQCQQPQSHGSFMDKLSTLSKHHLEFKIIPPCQIFLIKILPMDVKCVAPPYTMIEYTKPFLTLPMIQKSVRSPHPSSFACILQVFFLGIGS